MLLILGLAGVVLIAGLLIAPTIVVPRLLAPRLDAAISRAERACDCEISFGRIRYPLFRGLVVSDVGASRDASSVSYARRTHSAPSPSRHSRTHPEGHAVVEQGGLENAAERRAAQRKAFPGD